MDWLSGEWWVFNCLIVVDWVRFFWGENGLVLERNYESFWKWRWWWCNVVKVVWWVGDYKSNCVMVWDLLGDKLLFGYCMRLYESGVSCWVVFFKFRMGFSF